MQQFLLIFEIDKSYTLGIEEKPIGLLGNSMFTNLRPLLLFDNKATFCKNCHSVNTMDTDMILVRDTCMLPKVGPGLVSTSQHSSINICITAITVTLIIK